MREECLKRIQYVLISNGVDVQSINSELFMVLNDYELSKRTFEIATIEQRDIDWWVNKFLVAKKVKGCTDRTIKGYKANLSMFFREVNKNPLEITSDDIRFFLALKETRDKCSKVHLQNLYRTMSTFFGWLFDEEEIQKNPIKKVDSIKTTKKKKKAFSDIEVENIRYACKTKRETALIELLLSTGCRVSEICGARISDINYSNGSLLVHGKGQKDRIVYLNAKAMMAMNKYLEDRKDFNPYIFPSCKRKTNGNVFVGSIKLTKQELREWYKYPELVDEIRFIDLCTVESIIRNIGKRAGVEKTHPHRFRRTCATNALNSGMPIEYVSKMLGHESMDTTQIYLDISEDQLEQMHKKYVK